jgi:hypothetical protein
LGMTRPDIGCHECLHLLAAMRSAQMEAAAFCREVVARTRKDRDTTDVETRAMEAYARWDHALEALKEHIKLHPRIPARPA